MIGMKIDQAKGLFFDRKTVKDAMDRATQRALSKFGAFVRTRARSSIRKRKRVSEPGMPPSSHLGIYKQFIFFAYDPSARSVVIGPARLNTRLGNAPEALEKGGPSVVLTGSRRQRATRSVLIRKRPAMKPAFDAELPGVPALFRDAAR